MLRREDDIAELNRLREECDRLKAERAAREAEIATVVELVRWVMDRAFVVTPEEIGSKLHEAIARLGGAT